MKYLVTLCIVLVLAGCKDVKQVEYATVTDKNDSVAEGTLVHPGKKLLETQCYVCHNPTTPQGSRIAPPMVAIKAHYINSGTKKEDFISDIQRFVDSPTVEKARMRGAVRKFGVMPYQAFKKEEVRKIAEYLFDYKIEEPGWFKEHWGKGKKRGRYINSGKMDVGNIKEKTNFGELGLRYALGTKAVLGKNLMGKIQQESTEAALEFCNEKAYILTDSMSAVYNAQIKRVSDKPRNSKNQANKIELIYIEAFKKLVASGATINPIVTNDIGTITFYYPIITNSMCLQCHGTPNKEIQPGILKALATLYPDDRATGYSTNEVRGVWSIHFDTETD